jgi:menaquinone-dependent protoporphyrinogen oxidase
MGVYFMKNLIIYSTKHGGTEKIAAKIASLLKDETEVYNLKDKKVINLDDYQNIILGASIYAGKLRKDLISYSEDNLKTLLQKNTALFICCMRDGEAAKEQIENNFPEKLYNHSKIKAALGGEYNFDKLNFLEKIVVKKIAGVKESKSSYLNDKISEFAAEVNKLSL